jgi:hypothetical protein
MALAHFTRPVLDRRRAALYVARSCSSSRGCSRIVALPSSICTKAEKYLVVTCPWCGTNYPSFQSNCRNCGGSLPRPSERPTEAHFGLPSAPPRPPRSVPSQVTRRILFTDGWAVAGLVFALLGSVFSLVGAALALTPATAFVGIPFVALGVPFLLGAILLLGWRHQAARRTVEVLEIGEATLGEILTVQQNFHVRVNGRYPWTVVYRFDVNGHAYRGQVTTLSQPDLGQRPGGSAYVLYLRDNPVRNTLYPSPYGYYGL